MQSGQLWHCLANALKPSENTGTSAVLSYLSQNGIVPPVRNLSDRGLNSVWKKPEYWQALSIDGSSWHSARKDGPLGWRLPNKRKWVIQGEVHQKGLRMHYQSGCQNGLQEDCKWLCFRDREGLPNQEPQQLEDLLERWCLLAWGSQALQPFTEIKFVLWRQQIWILINFPLA